jgi:hypothetical protein
VLTPLQLVYLITTVGLGNAAFPRISIIMIAAVYGLQALIFIIKREFMLVGWMIVYILSYVEPVVNNTNITDSAPIVTPFTASSCPFTPSGAWTISLGVIHAL